MKALVLAADREVRLQPFSLTHLPALLPVANRPVLEWILSRLPRALAEIVIVCGTTATALRERFGSLAHGTPVRYVETATTPTPAAIAALLADMDDDTLVLNGHDMHAAADLTTLAARPGGLLGTARDTCGLGNGPATARDGAMLAAAHLDRAHLAALGRAAGGKPGATLAELILGAVGPAFPTASARDWCPLVYPWHIIEANVAAVRALAGQAIHGEVQKQVCITGNVQIGEGTVIKSGTIIEGPAIIGCNCTIGPAAYVRPDTVIGDECHLGFTFEIFDSVVFPGAKAKHRGYVGHSVIGSDVNLGAGFIASDYRHDGGKHVTLVGGVKVDTGRSKLGAFIGDGVRTGVHTITYPGRKIWPGLTTLPGAIVKSDMTG